MFWNVFVELCSAHNTSPNAVAADLKLSSGSVTAWKNGATPRITTLKKIADYFSVSTDYLLGGDVGPGIKKEPPKSGGLTVKDWEAQAENWSDSDVLAAMQALIRIQQRRQNNGH